STSWCGDVPLAGGWSGVVGTWATSERDTTCPRRVPYPNAGLGNAPTRVFALTRRHAGGLALRQNFVHQAGEGGSVKASRSRRSETRGCRRRMFGRRGSSRAL